MSEVSISIDNRVRLVAAVLAASRWPEHEQAQKPHAVHTHAKMTRQYVSDFADHPAVNKVNALLEEDNLDLIALFTAVLRTTWPHFEPAETLPKTYANGGFLYQLADFYTDSAVAAFFWSDNNAVWEEAAQELQNIFKNSKLPAFLSKLTGQELSRNLIIIPNLSYPALQTIGVETADTLFLIIPPPQALGESRPWPYREDTGGVVAQSCYALTGILLAGKLQGLDSKQQELLRHAAVTLCLEETLNQQESISYLVRSKKQNNLPDLPATIEKLRAYLENPDTGSLSDLV